MKASGVSEGVKGTTKPVGNLSSRVGGDESVVGFSNDENEGLVMVLFPKATWDAVVEMGVKLGVKPAEVVGGALKMMRERMEDVENGA